MNRLFYFHQYFKTPEEGGALRSYHIASKMVDFGIDVVMITTHNNRKYKVKDIDGIQVHYLPIYYSNNLSFTKRLIAFIKFVIKSVRLANSLPRPNLIYTTSTPLTVGIISLWFKWKKDIPYIFEVRDLWPEAPIQLNILKSRVLISIARSIEKAIYKNSSAMIALSPGIKEAILLRYDKKIIYTIANMADVSFYKHNRKKNEEKNELVIGYFGAMGVANNIEFILEAAHVCQQQHLKIRFIIAGDGARKKEVLALTRKMELGNIKILAHIHRNGIRELMSEVDACITSFASVPVFETNSPNKFFDGLAAGKLCIINTKGWLKELVEENHCGIYIDPNKPENFPSLIKKYINNKALLKTCQMNALNLADKKFNKDTLANQICTIVLKELPA